MPAIAASQEEDRPYFLGKNGNVYFFSVDDKTIEPVGVGDSRWVDIEAYANRLYVLRPTVTDTQGQIIRYDRSGATFAREQDWISSRTVALDQAVSLTVDGSVYILMRNGSIARFDSGG